MNRTAIDLERELIGLLNQQHAIYRQAWELLQPAGAGQLRQGRDVHGLLEQLNVFMEQAAQNEVVLRSRWHDWQVGQFTPTQALRDSWQSAEGLLKQLIECVEHVTREAEQARDAMLPALETGNVYHQMRAAYGRQE